MTELHDVRLGSATLSLAVVEEGTGPPLVLLHGFAASTFTWRFVIDHLASARRVVAFDRPGFGRSPEPSPDIDPHPYTVDGGARTTLALLDALGLDEATIIGHSAGGTIAVLVALLHPERVKGLVLIAPALDDRGPPPPVVAFARSRIGRTVGPAILRTAAPLIARGLRRAVNDPRLVDQSMRSGYRTPMQGREHVLWEMTQRYAPHGLGPRLAQVAAPTLVITGDSDRIVRPATSERAARTVPGAELVVVEGCGHLPHEERPDEAVRAIEAFLARVDG